MEKIITYSVLGCGSRGFDTYCKYLNSLPEKFKLVSVCDHTQKHLDNVNRLFPDINMFIDENDFFSTKRSDLLIIATQDKDHYRHCKKAFELGYDVLLEKPISEYEEELIDLVNTQKKFNNKCLVCYVLRYSPLFIKAKELLDSGTIGKLSSIQALEQARYDMFAHSYVRGRWKNMEKTTPVILAKSSHDLDLIQWYANSQFDYVDSIGSLSCFTLEQAPLNCSQRCIDCIYSKNKQCPYSAVNFYLDTWHKVGCPEDAYPYNTIDVAPITEDKILKALESTDYGKCVYFCENNAWDNQTTIIKFKNGVNASFTMTGVSGQGGRVIKLYGSLGELDIDEEHEQLIIKAYGKPVETLDYSVKNETGKGYEHSLSDVLTIDALYDYLTTDKECETNLIQSLESHLIGIQAYEKAVKHNG